MGVLAELAAEARARSQERNEAHYREVVELLHPTPEPRAGQWYRDAYNLGFSWRVQWVDERRVFLRMYDRDGHETASYIDWVRDRWPALVRQQQFTLVSGGD